MATVVRYRGAVISDRRANCRRNRLRSTPVPTLAPTLDAQCEGLAVGTLPECIAARAIADGKLVARSVTGMRDTTHCSRLAQRRGRSCTPVVGALDRPDLVDRLLQLA